MKLLMENWRKYLIENEEKQGRGIEQLCSVQGWTDEECIAAIVMSEDWEYAIEKLERGKDTLNLEHVIIAIEKFFQEEEERLKGEEKYRETDTRWFFSSAKRGRHVPHALPKWARRKPKKYGIPIENPGEDLKNIAKSMIRFVTGGYPSNFNKMRDPALPVQRPDFPGHQGPPVIRAARVGRSQIMLNALEDTVKAMKTNSAWKRGHGERLPGEAAE